MFCSVDLSHSHTESPKLRRYSTFHNQNQSPYKPGFIRKMCGNFICHVSAINSLFDFSKLKMMLVAQRDQLNIDVLR